MTEQLKPLWIRRASLGIAVAIVPAVWAQQAGDAPASAPLPAGGRPLQAVLDDYQGLAEGSSLKLQNQQLEAARSHAALQAARARFFPEVALAARYTLTDGGRRITLPVGQLLNPAYRTLNELLVAQGEAARFTDVGDVSFPLQLPREQDTRVTLRQPLYAPAISAGARAASAQDEAAGYGLAAFRRELRRDVRLAYLNWLAARTAAGIVADSQTLLQENLRVNESLLNNGKATPDAPLRARAELLAVTQQRSEAEHATAQAQRYLNFLLNRDAEMALEPSAAPVLGVEETAGVLAGNGAARPELAQLAAAQRAGEAQLQAAQAAKQPTLSLGVDAGTQGDEYRFGSGYNFVTGSLAVSWTLFDGGARTAAIDQARSASRQLANQRALTEQRIALEVAQARDALQLAAESLQTASARADAARAVFRIASRKRDEGMATPVEFLDARNALTSAELNLNLSRFDWLSRRTEYDYATASGELP
ncbi:MAG: TolC family protein [Steroidobacteraceae bacterium]